MPQSQTADNPMAPRGRATKQSRDARKTQKQSNQLSLPHQDDCKLEWTQSIAQQNIEQLQNPTMGVTIEQRINNNRTTALERTAA